MPELPEVHTTVKGLKKFIIGKTIKSVWSDFHIGAKYNNKENIKNESYLKKFKELVEGTRIKSAERIGKNILIHLNNKHSIIIHMKMTGNLVYDKEVKFVHLKFTLSNNKKLILSDMRKFASITISPTIELQNHERISKLGVDALDPKLTSKKFFECLYNKRGPIKSVLMDQESIAGLGNIYTDEILWESGVHPLSHPDKIPETKYKEIFKVMKKILHFSIKQGGDSKSDYRNIFGEKGNFQNFHKVYGRKSKKCPKRGCSGIIKRQTIGGRSAHFCPKHQIMYK
ncbi:MAG: bifunctional DNA-formamidopyrimidine glycosylase/DNA-(apurinic or apyrimidinic site) lyase [Candidatus Zambryskibacteria bacterium]|nr:bifunctional DNA-formamidopyrimidine glycosylase/DNA-(apurinic or apyrimidinic site) lyase [Candidatus Zambryskibacteria bacterium]